MFDLNIRFQIAAAFFLLIILYDYIRSSKLPLLSTRFFSLMMMFATINLVADMCTVYTITHLDTVPAWLNRFAHQIFIGSLDCVIVSLFFYVSILGKNQKRHDIWHNLIRLLPLIVALVMVVVGDLEYHVEGNRVYSTGLMATTVYCSVALYMALIYIDLIRYRKTMSAEKAKSICIGVSVWIGATIFQMLYPGILLSGLFAVLMVFFIYLSFENPKEHIDSDIQCFNKRAFHLMLSNSVASGKKMFILDFVFDNAKMLNNNFGHEFVNSLLAQAGHYLGIAYNTRVYHYREDSLSVILKGDEVKIMNLTRKVMDRFQGTWELSKTSITAEAHVDIIEFPKYAATIDEIYDTMNYMAEYHQGDAKFIRIVDDSYVEKKRRHDKIEEIVQKAIETEGLNIVYQPIYSVADCAFVSAEALVRLKDTTTIGFISPEEFIPIAERSGLIMQLGEIVFRKVCRFAHETCVKNFGVKYIEVNLSGIQCIDHSITNQLKGVMKEFKIDPSFINLEITETAAIESGDALSKNMAKLRSLGCSFSMDDFGTGYSNLSQMAETKYDLVKLDKSLIWPCFSDESKHAEVILENVVNMLSQLDVKIVAEGVETLEQTNKLTLMGIDYLQGYYYSKPINEVDFITFLAKNNR